MNLFPQIGSTVTNIVYNKTRTAARIEFSDGTSIYVKYDALIIPPTSDVPVTPSPNKPIKIVSERPITHMGERRSTRNTVPIGRRVASNPQNVVYQAESVNTKSVSNDALLKAKLRSESRINALSAEYDREHPSGEAAIVAMNS